ncbi:MAG: aminotransferase class V-fold PLP-dependent enzyme [Desulfobacterales bacterium]|jgi:selenocysteine lyase/cysteine desulfurase|nr:aminotransferase class V-fold PLP-dependent enzyme [Desulfobacterales bacterium]
MDWQKVHDAFPVNREMIWLNNCGTTPAGVHAVEAVTRHLTGYAQKGILTETAGYVNVRRNIKAVLAKLLNCRADELALIHNTAEGMNFVSRGLNLAPGDELILLENEYPSNIYPWKHWGKKGIRLLFAPMSDTPEEFFRGLFSLVNQKTRAMALSAVHWCTGMPLPLSAIGNLCRERGIALIIDGAQGVGMQPMDVKRMGISYMSFSAWKWLLGPLGVGVFYIAEDKLSELDPIFLGSESVIDDHAYLPYKDELKPTADRFTYSTGNWNDWVYFAASLDFLAAVGFETVRRRIFKLSDRLSKGLTAIGFKVLSFRHPGWPTGIVVCEKSGLAAPLILSHLKKHRIIAAERLGRIRFSPHIYNSPEQMDKVVTVLGALA